MNRKELGTYIATGWCTREIREVIVHCTATRPEVKADVEAIDGWHKARGFHKQAKSGHYCGYHFVIAPDGTIERGRWMSEMGAHVVGHNARSIGVVYAGGLDRHGVAVDTRTPEQKDALVWLLGHLKERWPKAEIKGHRDCSPDKNHNGKIEKWEWLKDCPCFDAKEEYKDL